MPEYCDSFYCTKADEEDLYKIMLEKNMTIELIKGCKRDYIVCPFRIVKNLFDEDINEIFNGTFHHAYKECEYGEYIIDLQCNKERQCYCFAIDRTHLGPPADMLTPDESFNP